MTDSITTNTIGETPVAVTETAAEQDLTHTVRRSPSMDTITSNVTGIESVTTSDFGGHTPIVPYNSPEPSVAGDRPGVNILDTPTALAERLAIAPLFASIQNSPAGTRVKAAQVNGHVSGTSDPVTRDASTATDDGAFDTFENSTWGELAEEDVHRALARLAMFAKDESVKTRGQQTVGQIYSNVLAKLIKAGEIEFDAKTLE